VCDYAAGSRIVAKTSLLPHNALFAGQTQLEGQKKGAGTFLIALFSFLLPADRRSRTAWYDEGV
jgi:hypothetical protein